MRRLPLLLFLLACGREGGTEADPEPLTCDYLEDPENCWARAATALADCFGEVDAQGTLSAERDACDFGNGVTLTFDQSLPTDSFDLESFGFTVFVDGQACGSFIDTFMNEMEIELDGEVTNARLFTLFTLTCADGGVYQTEFDTLFECAPGSGPTDAFDVTETEVWAQIIAASSEGRLFTCTP